MNDEQFEESLQALEQAMWPSTAEKLRARDTAQREALAQMKTERDQYDELHLESISLAARHEQALARVEAERDAMESMVVMLEEKEWAEHASKGPVSSRLETCITTLMNELSEANERAGEATVSGMACAEQRDTAQQQLAEAAHLLERATLVVETEPLASDILGFLSKHEDRHAQAEQQEAQSAQAGEFQREDRYIVIKRKDLEAAPFADRDRFNAALFLLAEHLPEREYLVIESDWPEYEPTWAAIQTRVSGQGAQAGDERAAFEEWAAVEFGYVVTGHWNGSRYVDREVQQEWTKWQARAALATQPAESAPAEAMNFEYVDLSGERRSVTITRDEVIEGMEDALYEKLGEQICRCEPIGETNVVDCNCQDYIEQFTLVKPHSSIPNGSVYAVRGAEHE